MVSSIRGSSEMDDKFPIINVTKGALAAPLSHMSSLIRSVVFLAIALGVPAWYGMTNGVTFEIIQGMADPSNTELMQQHGKSVGVTVLLLLTMMGPVSAYLFNYWVRFGAFGAEGAGFPSTIAMVSALFVNMVKFLLIFFLIGLVSFITMWVLGMIGIGPDSTEQAAIAASGDLRAATQAGFVQEIILLAVFCVIYSLFSANLTQTALKSEQEGMSHPHTIDFSIVLFLLYLAAFIPGAIAGLLNSWTLSIGVDLTIGVYIGLTIAVAHGLRYSICLNDSAQTDPAAEDTES